jgi:UDP:flavonoid glycosyltransferase YjiC (YdhE family)
MKTEQPHPKKLKAAVEKILADESYQKNVRKMAKQFARYNPTALCEKYVAELVTAD